jgi:hypothetical protein
VTLEHVSVARRDGAALATRTGSRDRLGDAQATERVGFIKRACRGAVCAIVQAPTDADGAC